MTYQKVHKEQLAFPGTYELQIKDLAEILSVQVQRDCPVLYFLRDESVGETTTVRVIIKGTGHDFKCSDTNNARFMGTVMTHGGTFAWHIWVKALI